MALCPGLPGWADTRKVNHSVLQRLTESG